MNRICGIVLVILMYFIVVSSHDQTMNGTWSGELSTSLFEGCVCIYQPKGLCSTHPTFYVDIMLWGAFLIYARIDSGE